MKYTCTKCLVEKERDEFYSDPRNVFKGVRSTCKSCDKEHRKNKWLEIGHTPADTERGRAWAKKNREKVNLQAKEKRKRNPEKYKAYAKKWQQIHPERRIANDMRQRASRANALVAWADQEKIAEIYLLAKKLTKQTGIKHHVDHIVPIRAKEACGLHCEFNLQVLPATENISKGNRIPKELLEWILALPSSRLVAMTT